MLHITSKIEINPTPKSIIVCFCVEDGKEIFLPYLHCLQDFFKERNCFTKTDYKEGNTLLDEEWSVEDGGGHIILLGKKQVTSPVGELDWFGFTDFAKYIEDCDDEEIELILEANHNGEIEDEDLADLIHTSLVNHKPINTMEELADYWNSCNECPFDLPDVIEKNGWHEPDDISELELTICFDDEGNRVEINDEGNAEVIYA